MQDRRLFSFLLIILACSFHFLVTLPIGEAGIRASLSDLIVLVLIFLMYYVGRENTIFNQNIRYLLPWFFILSTWFTVSLINGYLYTEELMFWAIINKYLGWYVLFSYLLSGIFLWSFSTFKEQNLIIKYFVMTSWFVAIYAVVKYILAGVGIFNIGLEPRISGFSGNSNAYGFLVATSLIVQIVYFKTGYIFSKKAMSLGIVLCLFALMLSVSRSAWLGFSVACIGLIWMKRIPVKETMYLFFISTLVLNIFLLSNTNGYFKARDNRLNLDVVKVDYAYVKEKFLTISDDSISQRLDTVKSGIEKWLEHPIKGIGLGSFYWNEVATNKEFPLTIHNTFIWLLVETGLVGVFLFLLFLLMLFSVLKKNIDKKNDNNINVVAFSILLASLGTSISMEVMYQRQIWFLLGCALGSFIINKNKENTNISKV